jgi:chemotaxis protein methyltransferase CheR
VSARVAPETVARFRRFLAAQLALKFDDEKAELLSRVLEERAAAQGAGSPEAYLARLSSASREELGALAEQLTVGETYFFRNEHDTDAFTGAVLPARTRARASERRLRILSAGCSSGEEPYTLAMLLRDQTLLAGWDVRIHAFDVNPAAIARARAARYSAWSLRQTPPEMRDRFFTPDGRELLLADEVRSLVTLEERNLAPEDPAFWSPGAFDVVFCRNVLMYLEPEAVRRIVARIASALAPGGFLFLGHAETLRGVSTDFHLRQTDGTFYYQTRGGAEAAPAARARSAPSARVERPPRPAPGTGWMDAIHEASQRIAALSGAGASTPGDPGARRPAGLPATDAPPARGAIAVAHELLERERFLEALAALGPAADRDRDVDALLLRAVLLASSGDAPGAEAVCERVLQLDELNAEAHYLRALCRDHGGDRAAAADHDRYALYLDPTFAMPRLHLGLLAKRAGDVEHARRELARALGGFAAEDGSRILLLGGGFTRDGLVALCRAELAACGGAP